jgi:hypothetical protein
MDKKQRYGVDPPMKARISEDRNAGQLGAVVHVDAVVVGDWNS